jgi:hypothetical protein
MHVQLMLQGNLTLESISDVSRALGCLHRTVSTFEVVFPVEALAKNLNILKYRNRRQICRYKLENNYTLNSVLDCDSHKTITKKISRKGRSYVRRKIRLSNNCVIY